MAAPTFFLDLNSISDTSPDRIGGKGAGLQHLAGLGLRMPPAWVLPTDVFNSCISSSGLGQRIESLEKLIGSEPPPGHLEIVHKGIATTPLPKGLIVQAIKVRGQWRDSYGGKVIVRSSATVEDNKRRSFAGIFESIPCESELEIADAIRKVWASVFSRRAFAYYGIASLKRFPAMALILQPFIEADRSGVMFTRFTGPEKDDEKVLVEHVQGDCEKLVKGEVNPDRFWIKRWPEGNHDFDGALTDLEPRFALELGKAAQKLETALKGPQDVEWCVRNGDLYLLQTRPITTGRETTAQTSSGNILLKGVAASAGRAGGAVHLVFNIEDADALQTGQVLTTTMTNPDMVPSMQRSSAVVTDVGGMICHAAIVSRELGIPCVVGTKNATKNLEPGSLVTVDGGHGIIYQGLIVSETAQQPAGDLQWRDLWQGWQKSVADGTIPQLPTIHALAEKGTDLKECVLDPYLDLCLDARVDIAPLATMEKSVIETLIQAYLKRVAEKVRARSVEKIFLDLHRFDPEIRDKITNTPGQNASISVLESLSEDGSWRISSAGGDRKFAILKMYTSEALQNTPAAAITVVPLGFGLLFAAEKIELPDPSKQGPGGMFGMAPEVRMAAMPARECREAMHHLIPALSEAHGGKIPVSTEQYPWLDLRPEVPITPFLKAFVTPAVESIPHVLGFDDPPLHVQFIRCRFHFRQDTLFGFFPKLMQATWDESFLSDLLQRCRKSYQNLEKASEVLPENETDFQKADPEALQENFLAWWRAFSEFFSLSFFIQAQGDDCVFPALKTTAETNIGLLKQTDIEAHIPDAVQLSAPVTPVLTAEYMQDLSELKQILKALSLEDISRAESAVASERYPQLNKVYERVWRRWHWMRERDPYYDPYDTPAAILTKALAIRDAEPADYGHNLRRANLALALHFDLARLTNTSEKLVYAVKYGRALAIDRENHHIVWLRASYQLRKLLLEWQRRLMQHNPLQHRDIFFMQPWEILDAVAALPQSISGELLNKIRNRRTAYEREIQLKAGKAFTATPEPEMDYY